MILTDFDAEKYERTIREEGREEGREYILSLINKLNRTLLSQNRLDDLKRAAEDAEYQKQLIKELEL